MLKILESLDWGRVAFYASLLVSVLGALALTVVSFLWSWAARRYRETWPKVGMALFRAVAATAGLLAKGGPSGPNPPGGPGPSWAFTVFAAVVGYLLWELTATIGDLKAKKAKEEADEARKRTVESLEKELAEAEPQYARLWDMVLCLNTITRARLQRVRAALRSSEGTRGSIAEVRKALGPGDQIGRVLESFALLFRTDVLKSGGRSDQNFRVAVYVEQEGALVQTDAFDLNARRHEPFPLHERNANRFLLGNSTDPSLAVRCVNERRLIIVPEGPAEPTFQFDEAKPPTELQSIMACPISDFRPDGKTSAKAALVVDTDVLGHFREEDRKVLEFRCREFALRVELEYNLQRLLR